MQVNPSFGASNSLFGVQKPNDVHRSKFDLSRIRSFTADPGMIIPFDTIETLPGDDFDLSVDFALETMPLVSPSLTGYKVLIHAHYLRLRDVWKGWDNFITKGRTGNIALKIPRINNFYASYASTKRPSIPETTVNGIAASVYYLHNSVHSLSAFLGFPPVNSGSPKFYSVGSDIKVLKYGSYLPYSIRVVEDGSAPAIESAFSASRDVFSTGIQNTGYCSALPFMAYQNIVRNNYISQNLLQDCAALFPVEGDSDWLLPYAADVTNFVGIASSSTIDPDKDNSSHTGVYSVSDKSVRLDYLRYVQFDDDYFTTALPWLQRGSNNFLNSDVSLTLSKAPVYAIPRNDLTPYNDGLRVGFEKGKVEAGVFYPDSYFSGSDADSVDFRLYADTSAVKGSVSLSVNSLREAIALQVWQERNMRVDGSYNKMIYQHWRENPKVHEHYPEYIGGTFAQVNFSSILQQSESSAQSPLGSQAGRGYSTNSANIGHFHCDDYGFIIIIIIIKP